MNKKPAHCKIDEDKDALHSWDKCREGDCIKQCGYNSANPKAFSFDPNLFVEVKQIKVTVMVEAEHKDDVNELINSINWVKIVNDEVKRENRRRKREGEPYLTREAIAGLHCKTNK